MAKHTSTRAGVLQQQSSGYSAFLPAPLPPDPPIDFTAGLLKLLSEADQRLGRLDGVVKTVPDPDFFVAMYVRREAVLSSQIEGTQSTLEDLLAVELDASALRVPNDVDEIVNYVAAMRHGLRRLADLPLSLRLIREIHKELLRGGRGAKATPGEFRKTQNWIGAGGASIERATFVPPPVPEMKTALSDFEKFLNSGTELPLLIEIGLAHAQFETIHPFLDGNGRVGRLLITLMLVQRGALRSPLLYQSYYFKLHRSEYYDRLTAVREHGDWEGWLEFFLSGVGETAEEATATAERIFELREAHRKLVIDQNLGPNALLLISLLFARPIINVNLAKEHLGVAWATANKLVAQFEELGLLIEMTGQKRSRVFRYAPYLKLFDEPTPAVADGPIELTEAAPTAAG